MDSHRVIYCETTAPFNNPDPLSLLIITDDPNWFPRAKNSQNYIKLSDKMIFPKTAL